MAPMGPRAWSLSVLMPTSAPRPYSPPSAKRVEALTMMLALSTPLVNASAEARDSVRMASVWWLPYWLMWVMAASRESTIFRPTMGARYSVDQSCSVADLALG